jgi:hypothetical protein
VEARTLQGADWLDIVEVLHGLTNMITVRAHYSEGHPAIASADRLASEGFIKILDRVPDVVVALIDGEFVVCERPMTDLRERIPSLALAMTRHGIECLVFQQGVTANECSVLGRALSAAADEKGRVRELAQAALVHVLLRFADIKTDDKDRIAGNDGAYLVPLVEEILSHTADALTHETPLDMLTIRSVANRVVGLCNARSFRLEPRSYTHGLTGAAIHAANVALASAAMAASAGYPESVCVDLAAAALLHDVGHLLLPEEIRGVPEPLLDERALPVFRNHAFAGALVLLGAGCPPLWVAVALEHHRGIDGGGYPALGSREPPHELVRMVALANFYDRKRTSLDGRVTEPEDLLREIAALEPKYFGAPLLERFTRALGVFPPGTTVELSDRMPAVVTRASAGDPWRPQVTLLRGPDTGKRIELREMNVAEGRHQRSIVRAIAPPLMRPEDIVIPAEEMIPAPEESWPEVVFAEEPREPRPAGPSGAEVARKELAYMGSMLDDLASVGDALRGVQSPLVSASPPASAPFPASPLVAAPPAPPVFVTNPPVAPPPPAVFVTKPPPVVSQPAPAATKPPPVVTQPPAVFVTQPPAVFATKPPVVSQPAPAVTQPPAVFATKPPAVFATKPPVVSQPAPAATKPPVVSQPAPAATKPPPVVTQPPLETPRSLPPKVEVSRPPAASADAAPLVGTPSLAVSAGTLGALGLDHRAGFVLSLVDGMSDVETIVDVSGIPRVEVERILAELLADGVVKMTK